MSEPRTQLVRFFDSRGETLPGVDSRARRRAGLRNPLARSSRSAHGVAGRPLSRT